MSTGDQAARNRNEKGNIPPSTAEEVPRAGNEGFHKIVSREVLRLVGAKARKKGYSQPRPYYTCPPDRNCDGCRTTLARYTRISGGIALIH